jgi:F-type H+-transporting ATPase subunit gamma
MANLRDIKKRIGSVQSTKQITRTMEMVSSAKIRRASERVQAATPYSNAMEDMLGHLADKTSASDHPLLEVRDEIHNILVIAVTSDRGLAGAFNSSVLRKCDKIMSISQSRGIGVQTIACGKKAISYLSYRGREMVREYRDLSADPTVTQAFEIASIAAQLYTSGEIDMAFLVYNHARNAADQDVVVVELLPMKPGVDVSIALKSTLPREDFEQYRGRKPREETQTGVQATFEFEPDTEEVLNTLLPAYLNTQIYHALLDSAAAEQGARRKAMKAATDNATEMIDTLTRVYNGVRQSAITTEITEIVGGAAAAEE